MQEPGRKPPVTASTVSSTELPKEEDEASFSCSGLKKGSLSCLVSLQESFRYVKAFVVGQTKVVTAKNEKEAARADLLTSKMQVEATDAAEDTKKRLDVSS